MSCDHGIDAGAYALEALEPQDAADYARHLDDCAACQREVWRMRHVVDALALAAPTVSPPAQLRARIMREVYGQAELLRAAGPGADRRSRLARRRRRL
jgi:anti-sigma factor RsiW